VAVSFADRIRAGEILPWVGEGVDGARRSAQICDDEIFQLDRNDPRRAEIEEQRGAWLDLAAKLAEYQ